MDRSTLQRIVIVGGGTAGNHLKEEESKFFQVAGRLLSATKKKQLARKCTREIVRMRRHCATEYETVAVAVCHRQGRHLLIKRQTCSVDPLPHRSFAAAFRP